MTLALPAFRQPPARPSFKHSQQLLIRAAFAQLSPDAIDQIARRVADLLQDDRWTPTPQLVDAAELARRYGLTRAWIYEHAELLGAIRLGTGPRARLRFDPQQVAAVLHHGTQQPHAHLKTTSPRRTSRTPSTPSLLPIHTSSRRTGRG